MSKQINPGLLLLDTKDVLIRPLSPRDCCCGKPAAKEVWVDFRRAGMTVQVGQFCLTCARDVSARIKEGIGR